MGTHLGAGHVAGAGLRGRGPWEKPPDLPPPPTATTLVLLAGVLLPGWGSPERFRKTTKINGAQCSHLSECHSDCCLLNLDTGITSCALKAKITMECLPQTKGAINIICPCGWGLRCTSKNQCVPASAI
ncbi:colipase-like protein 2 [Tamandua tetradactyla]|uniref:colipase-like protein 2 n=1 Tax=Tamandua tetradactyla TaxID=48850 RepID=UPI004053C6AC